MSVSGIRAGAIVLALVNGRGMTLASIFTAAPIAVTSINPGLVALFANAAVFIAISAAQRARIATSVESA